MVTRHIARWCWRLLALASVALAVVGALLPVLPSVPFLLVAAWAAGKGWPQLEAWLLAHPRYGPPIQRWRDHGAVSRGAKWAATLGMLGSTLLIALSGLPLALKIGAPALMAAVAGWLWKRPEV